MDENAGQRQVFAGEDAFGGEGPTGEASLERLVAYRGDDEELDELVDAEALERLEFGEDEYDDLDGDDEDSDDEDDIPSHVLGTVLGRRDPLWRRDVPPPPEHPDDDGEGKPDVDVLGRSVVTTETMSVPRKRSPLSGIRDVLRHPLGVWGRARDGAGRALGMGRVGGSITLVVTLVLAFSLVWSFLSGYRNQAYYDEADAWLVVDCVEAVEEDVRNKSREGSPEELQLEYAHLIYSVFHEFGLTDAEIAGMLGSFQKECGIDPTTIEGIYDEPFDANGPRKGPLMNDEKAMSDWTIQLLCNPHPKGYGGHLDSDGHVRGASTPSGLSVNSDFYGPGGDKGLFYPGIGIGSWTGHAQVSAVIGMAKSVGRDWWDIDYQIACCLALPGCGEHGTAVYDRYRAACDGLGAADCATWFMRNWEIGPETLERGFAEEWYARITSERWSSDRGYANTILSLANELSEESIGDYVAERVLKECKKASRYDNSTIAKALVSYAYSRPTSFGDGNPGTDIYKQVFEAVAPGDEYFRSCDRAVACAIRWSGADKDFPLGACDNQNQYAMQSGDWEHVCDFQSSGGDAASVLAEAEAAGLQPGDCLFSYGNYHTMAYVGTEAVDEIWDSYLSSTGAAPHGAIVDGQEPEDLAAWVDGSIGENGSPSTYDSGVASGRAPGIGTGGGTSAHSYGVFRYKGNYPYREDFADVVAGVRLS